MKNVQKKKRNKKTDEECAEEEDVNVEPCPHDPIFSWNKTVELLRAREDKNGRCK